ncbi:hypothetical protein AAVH_09211 [Aphelenchoides avenae]|nr:hypothetical protein AAVH_09211 [Aphelenchus avenae]
MPTKRHTRLRIYEESFTGKEATDHLASFIEKIYPCKNPRQSSINLLGKLLEKGLFYNCRDEKDLDFKDNAKLYK